MQSITLFTLRTKRATNRQSPPFINPRTAIINNLCGPTPRTGLPHQWHYRKITHLAFPRSRILQTQLFSLRMLRHRILSPSLSLFLLPLRLWARITWIARFFQLWSRPELCENGESFDLVRLPWNLPTLDCILDLIQIRFDLVPIPHCLTNRINFTETLAIS